MNTLLADLLGILQGIGVDPQELHIEALPTGSTPYARITFRSKADLEKWTAVEWAKVEHINKTHMLGHHEFSALYDKPDRRMFCVARVFPHMPEWADTNGEAK